jgi:hypothetical protein
MSEGLSWFISTKCVNLFLIGQSCQRRNAVSGCGYPRWGEWGRVDLRQASYVVPAWACSGLYFGNVINLIHVFTFGYVEMRLPNKQPRL